LAGLEDSDWIVALAPRLHDFGPPPWRVRAAMDEAVKEDQARLLANLAPGSAIFAAVDADDNPLGFVTLRTDRDYFTDEPAGHVVDIVVSREAEVRGVGRALLAAAEALGQRSRISLADVECLCRQRAGSTTLRTGGLHGGMDAHVEAPPLVSSSFAFLQLASGSGAIKERTMKSHKVNGGGGIQLHLVETGNPNGRPILFIHGLSQCWLAWSRQLSSDLAANYRLVAMDMRGHGFSDKPREAYADSKLWAEDVNQAIKALRLEQAILCGWSYGPLVILDYLRHFGEDSIAGLNFVAGITKLGSDSALSVLTPEFLSLVSGFFAVDVEESVNSLKSLLQLCFVTKPTSEELFLMLGFNVLVPPYVRQALLSRSFDNDDLLPKIRKPVLITHGANDAIVKPAIVDEHLAGLSHAQTHIIPNVGHAPFWEAAAAFNQRLAMFAESL